MICPLLTAALYVSREKWGDLPTACYEIDCAWYDEEKNACSIKVVAKELTRIQLKLPTKLTAP